MSSVVIAGNTSGSITVSAPDVSGSNTLTLPAVTSTIATNVNGTLYPLVSGTAVASTSGTSIDFTGIPSWVKRITVMFTGVSTSGTSLIQVQVGTGGVATTSGYTGYYSWISAATVSSGSTSTGFAFQSNSAGNNISGAVQIFNISGNTWVGNVNAGSPGAATSNVGGGTIALGGVLNFIRITTVNGTDTFDAGSINILYE